MTIKKGVLVSLAKSRCTCGHKGDGSRGSEHAGVIGHGYCLVCPEGECEKFTWAEYLVPTTSDLLKGK